jgi:hypothetical protein
MILIVDLYNGSFMVNSLDNIFNVYFELYNYLVFKRFLVVYLNTYFKVSKKPNTLSF